MSCRCPFLPPLCLKHRAVSLWKDGRRRPRSPLAHTQRGPRQTHHPPRQRVQAFIPRDKKGGTPVCNQTLAAKLDRREHERHRNAIRQARSRTDYSPPPPSIIGDDRAAAMRRHARLLAIEDGNARLLDKASALALALVLALALALALTGTRNRTPALSAALNSNPNMGPQTPAYCPARIT